MVSAGSLVESIYLDDSVSPHSILELHQSGNESGRCKELKCKFLEIDNRATVWENGSPAGEIQGSQSGECWGKTVYCILQGTGLLSALFSLLVRNISRVCPAR